VIADSAATKHDLTRYCGVPEGKITVVYPGYDDALARVDAAAVRARYGLPENYFLHVGTLQPRKNLMRLMEAVSQAPAPVRLVLAGRAGWMAAPIAARARELSDRVRWLEYVPDEDLAGLYSGAQALVFPSLFEGFGFPVLEAMACGTPVICSNTSSLPEVAGQAALLVDPQDGQALLRAMLRVQAEPALRAELAERGLSRVRQFSWRRAAEATLAVLEEAVC
jgi:glycosyltransferase involved in cell wall biosynthesis